MILFVLLLGCGSPTHLQYDHGRAYYQSLSVQSDRTRPSVPEGYPLSGTEAAAIRLQVEEKTSDEASDDVTIGK